MLLNFCYTGEACIQPPFFPSTYIGIVTRTHITLTLARTLKIALTHTALQLLTCLLLAVKNPNMANTQRRPIGASLALMPRFIQMGWTPLTRASARGYRETAEILLQHKANINAKDDVSRSEGASM